MLTDSGEQDELYDYRDTDIYIHAVLPMNSPVQCELEMLHNR